MTFASSLINPLGAVCLETDTLPNHSVLHLLDPKFRVHSFTEYLMGAKHCFKSWKHNNNKYVWSKFSGR